MAAHSKSNGFPLKMVLLPLVSGAAAYGLVVARGGSGPMHGVVEAGVAAGVGFLIAAGWTALESATETKSVRKQSVRHVEVARAKSEVEALREELRALETGLQTYLRAKSDEGQKLRDAVTDLTHDVTRLRDADPSENLRPQLEAIAEKFGELAGVRAVVATLSAKMVRVEGLADQLAAAESRIPDSAAQRADLEALRAELEAAQLGVKEELRAEMQELVRSQVARRASQPRQIVPAGHVDLDEIADVVQANLEEVIDGRVRGLVQGLRKVSGEDTESAEKIALLERRIAKMSGSLEAMRATVDDVRANGGGMKDDGIPSVHRKPAGIDVKAPENKVKGGCLAKMFQDNMKLRDQLKAAA